MKQFVFLLPLLVIALASCKRKTINGYEVKEAEFNLHDKFSVLLPENHTKAETWHLSENYNKDLLDYTTSVWEGNEKGVNFLFKATQKGETLLLFKKRTYNAFTDSVRISITVK
jgi:hypothetical protein